MSRPLKFYTEIDLNKFIVLRGFENWKGNNPDDYSDEAIEDFINAYPHEAMGYNIDFIRNTLKKIQYRYAAERLLDKSLEDSNLENVLIISLVAETGLRIEELCSLKVSDIIFTDSVILVKVRGSKTRYSSISYKALKWLNTYIEMNNLTESDYLFSKNNNSSNNRQTNNSKYTRQAIYNKLKALKTNELVSIDKMRNSFKTLDLYDMEQLTDRKKEFQIVESINKAIALIENEECSIELCNAIDDLIDAYQEMEDGE